MAFETITNKNLSDISTKLEKAYPHWRKMVADSISKEKDWKNYSNAKCSEENTRHISNGKIKSQFHRRLFMKAAAKLLLGVAQETQEINDLVKQID